MPTNTLYPNVPAAIGAWVAAEMRAAIANPQAMLDIEGLDLNLNKNGFSGLAFEAHLLGMLSDLLEFCTHGCELDKPCYLVVLANDDTASCDTQFCLQGRVYIERATYHAQQTLAAYATQFLQAPTAALETLIVDTIGIDKNAFIEWGCIEHNVVHVCYNSGQQWLQIDPATGVVTRL